MRSLWLTDANQSAFPPAMSLASGAASFTHCKAARALTRNPRPASVIRIHDWQARFAGCQARGWLGLGSLLARFFPLACGRRNPKGRQGRMNERRRRFWFAAIQMARLTALRLVTHGIKALIKLRRWIPVLFYFASVSSEIETAVFSKTSQAIELPQSDGPHTARL